VLATPNVILKKGRKEKAGGECRDFAKLLEWSLLQVSRSLNRSQEMKDWGALDEESFSVRMVMDSEARHDWVDVLLPVGVGDRQIFHRISLDTTQYETYTPLFPRRTGTSTNVLSIYKRQCHKVEACLEIVNCRFGVGL
jgi:hypothetical protein